MSKTKRAQPAGGSSDIDSEDGKGTALPAAPAAGAAHGSTTAGAAASAAGVGAVTAGSGVSTGKLNPADFKLSKLRDTFVVREPGTIVGQQFIIEECTGCDIYLCDNSATVSIDDCHDCRIFIGPCEASVFVRTSTDMLVVVASQQLRLRDCVRCVFFACVPTPPSQESSSAIQYGCFHSSFAGIERCFQAAGLSPLNNLWFRGYDFSETTLPASGRPSNWSLVAGDARAALRGLNPDDGGAPGLAAALTAIGFANGPKASAVPFTVVAEQDPTPAATTATVPRDEHVFVAFFANYEQTAVEFARDMCGRGAVLLRQVWRTQMGPADVKRLWAEVLPSCSVLAKAGTEGFVTGMYFVGPGAARQVGLRLDAALEELAAAGQARGRYFAYSSPSSQRAQAEALVFFERETTENAEWRGSRVN